MVEIRKVYVMKQVSKSSYLQSSVVKVGITYNIAKRIRQLSSGHNTWYCVYSVETFKARKVERLAHKMLKKYRMANEFFICDTQVAIQAVEDALVETQYMCMHTKWVDEWLYTEYMHYCSIDREDMILYVMREEFSENKVSKISVISLQRYNEKKIQAIFREYKSRIFDDGLKHFYVHRLKKPEPPGPYVVTFDYCQLRQDEIPAPLYDVRGWDTQVVILHK